MSTAKFARVVAVTGVVVVAAGVVLGLSVSAALAADPEEPAAVVETGHASQAEIERIRAESAKVYAIAIAVVISMSCLAAGYAVGKVGSAAMGAMSEKPELAGRALLFVALAEGIAIYGVLAAILLYTKITT